MEGFYSLNNNYYINHIQASSDLNVNLNQEENQNEVVENSENLDQNTILQYQIYHGENIENRNSPLYDMDININRIQDNNQDLNNLKNEAVAKNNFSSLN